MAELIPYKKKNVILRLRSGSIAEKWFAGFLGFEEVSLPERDYDQDPFASEPLVNQDARKFYTNSEKSDMVVLRKGIENEGASAGDAGESLAEPQSAGVSTMNKAGLADMGIQALRKEAKALGIDTSGLDKDQLISEIEYVQGQEQNERE